MMLDYSPKERFDKIVEILAEGTINLIRYKAKLSLTMRQSMQEWLGKVMGIMAKNKFIKSCTITTSFAETNIEKNRQRRYVEPTGKTYSLSQTIVRD
ncbi:MAG: hypothetical protein WC515_06320 [Candidatus Omnitrophota bacterium]